VDDAASRAVTEWDAGVEFLSDGSPCVSY